MNQPAIRRADHADIPLLSELGASTFRETYSTTADPADVESHAATRYTPSHIERWLAEPDACTFLASLDGVVVGYAQVRRGDVPACVDDRAALQLARLYARGFAQGRGVGAALMRAALDQMAALGGRTAWLGVYERNPKAIAFYRAWGFAQVGHFEFDFNGKVFIDPVLSRRL
jgi:ribosomal protein S18 acetylase RimI-like enzyme